MAKLLSNTRVYGTATIDTRLFVNGNLSAHSTNTGALQVFGGIGISGGGFFGGTVTATSFVGTFAGNISGTASLANDIVGGTAGQLLYQVAPSDTGFVGPGTAGQILVSAGAAAPVYTNTSSIYVNSSVFTEDVRGGTAGQLVYQSAANTTAFAGPGTAGQVLTSGGTGAPVYVNTGSLYVGRAVLADSVVGGVGFVNTVATLTNAAFYMTFVDSNNSSPSQENIYTTSSFVVNPSTGNVGLGTTTPADKLELSGGPDAARIKITNASIGRSSILGHGASGFYWQPTNNGDIFELRNAAGSGLFALNPNTANVGVGTTGPSTKLHVAGSTGDTRIRVSADDGTNMRGYEITAGTTFKGGMFYRTTEGNVMQIWGPNTSAGAIHIDTNNVVDILASSSVHSTSTGALQVIGGVGVGGGGFFGGVVTATTFVGNLIGSVSQVSTQQATTNAAHFVTFVDSNNLTAAAEAIYTTSSLVVNPGTGNVGIGTTSPSNSRLHIVGDWVSGHSTIKIQPVSDVTAGIGFYNTDGSRNGYVARTSSAGIEFFSGVNLPLTFYANNARVVDFLANGNVGVGTLSPINKLQVVGGSGTTIGIADSASGNRARIFWQTTTNYVGVGLFNDDNSNLMFGTTATERMRITAAGNVGINTISPAYRLDIQGGSVRIGDATYNANLLFGNNQGTWGSGIRVYDNSDAEMRIWHMNGRGQIVLATGYNGDGSVTLPTDGLFIIGDTTASPALKVGVGYTAANMRGGGAKFAVNGNVGIGTTTPNTRLEVWGTAASAASTSADNGIFTVASSNGVQLQFTSLSNSPYGYALQTKDDNNAGPYNYPLILQPVNGNVGIGVSSPQKKLDVSPGAGIVASFGGTITVGAFAGIHFGYSESSLNNDTYKKSALVFERTDGYTGQGGNAGGKIHFLLNNALSTSATALTDAVVTIDSNSSGTAGSVRMGVGNRNPSFNLDISGTARATSDFRAPIFYDTDNTGFYTDPASTSRVNIVTLNGITSNDIRSTVTTPQTYNNIIRWDFFSNSTNGLSDGGTYNGVMYWRKYGSGGDWSGGGAVELGYTDNARMWMRYGSSTSWGSWKRFIFGDNFNNGGIIATSGDMRAPIFYDYDDTNFYLDPASSTTSLQIAGAIEQGNNFAHPNIEWSASSSSSGMVIFYLPGNSGNYGMIHAVFDYYEYNSPRVATIIVGGHNWNGSWYNIACNVVGYIDKQVRVGFKDGQYVIVFGTSGSSWSYGTIRLRKIHNGSFYNNVMNLGGAYSVTQTTTESFSYVSGDIRNLRTPATFIADADVRSPIFYDLNDTSYYLDPRSASRLSGLRLDGVDNNASGSDYILWINKPNNNDWGVAITGQLEYNYLYDGAASHSYGVRGLAGGSEYWRVGTDLLYHNSNIRAPIFYDQNNTAYYCDPASTSRFANTEHFNGGIAYFYTVTNNSLRGYIQATDTDDAHFIIATSGGEDISFRDGGVSGSVNMVIRGNATVEAYNDFRAPIFYDSNNTAYYLDPENFNRLDRLVLDQARVDTSRFPVGHYSSGDTVFDIDPTWTNDQLQAYFNNSNVTWVADSTAPGGYAIQISGGVSVGGAYGSGFPYIPVDQNDIFYMEVWIKSVSGSNGHYMGSIDYNESFGSLGGNPGSFGYWVMSNSFPGSSWTKYSGYITGFGNSTGQFKSGTKYFTPQALFNYSGGGVSYISGWKCIKVSQFGNRTIIGRSGSIADNSQFALDVYHPTNYRQLRVRADSAPLIKLAGAYNSNNGAELWQDSGGVFRININGSLTGLAISTSPRTIIYGGLSTSRYEDEGGTFLFRSGSGSGATRHLNLADTTSDPSASVTSEGTGTGISWGQRGDNQPYYMIRQSYRNFGGSTYTKLTLNWHTGMILGSNSSYGGIRFYSDAFPISETLNFHVNGGSNYLYKYVWLYTNTTGMYSDTNSAHIYPNTGSTYTQWRIDGSRNSYGGIWDSYSAVNGIMYDSGGNGGVYREANGRWYWYHNVGNNSMGIGSSATSSSYRLYINDNGFIANMYANAYYYASDRKFKENINTISGALDLVEKFRGVTYTKKGDEEQKLHMGVIAQEVEEIFPSLVTKTKDHNEEEYLSVSYGNMAGLFIEAFREMKEKLNEANKRIEMLEKMLEK
jgi:hypothetical protein